MENTARDNLDETAAVSTEPLFSDEEKAMILEIEEYMEQHPDEWLTSEEFFAGLDKI